MPSFSPTAHAPWAVLDTNATLDWLVFNDPGIVGLRTSIESGQVGWLACQSMRKELSHMLNHPRLAHWQHNARAGLEVFDALSTLVPEPLLGADRFLRCSDSDDQVFMDLAIAYNACWLVTHDRALLKFARRARLLGIAVVQPSEWLPKPPHD